MTVQLSAPVSPGQPASYVATSRTRADALVRAGAVTLWTFTMGMLVVAWMTGGGLTDLLGWGSGLTSLGRLTGLVAANLMLVQVLLMARVPALDHAFGQDRIARGHRLIGLWSFNLMLAHIVLVSWGYAGGALLRLPAMLWQLVIDYPGVLLAAGGTLAVVMVSVTSVRAARRRLRYESWHLLHLYAYLGAGLALPHQLWTGQQFVSSPLLRLTWWSLWGAAVAATLVWRVGLPLARTWRHQLRVTSVVPEGDGVLSVYVTGRKLHRFGARAGQFAIWRFLGRPGWTRGNPYSFSAAPDGRSLRLTVKDLGDGSGSLRSLPVGTRVAVEGPYGRLTSRARSRRAVAFIGAGVGVTPLRALAEELDYQPWEAVLVQRHSGQPLFDRELQMLARERGLHSIDLGGRRRWDDSWVGDGFEGLDDRAALLWLVPDIATRDVYICGPDPWMDSVLRAAVAAGVPQAHLHMERFSW